MASFEYFIMDSREVSLIFHLLFNGDTGKVQITKRDTRTIIYIMFGWAHGISSPGVLVPRTSIWAQKGAKAVSTVITPCMFSQLFRHPRLELGGVLIIWGKWAAIANQAPITAIVKWTSAQRRSVLSFLQPLPFLFRQHISPRALFMQPRPCTQSRPPTRRRRPTRE